MQGARPARHLRKRTRTPLCACRDGLVHVTADGQRFLIGTVLDGPNAAPPSPVIVLDWTRELTRP